MNADRLGGRKTLEVTGFLEEFEKEAVKKGVDIIALFDSFGVELTRKGKGYTGRCPWHEDSTPSLSVDRDKGLYHCFGCGESGDVVSLVEKMKGVGFREALAYLGSNGPLAGSRTNPLAAAGKKEAGERRPPAVGSEALPARGMPDPSAAVAPEREQPYLLDEVARRYASTLAATPEARAYLATRKLDVPELVSRFGLGYSDGKLAEVLGASQKAELQRLGVLKASEREHFSGCITVPLWDDAGHVAGFYGRRVVATSSPAHLYLPGPHQGLVNRQAARVYRDELVLTESVLDALSLVALGLPNVLPCYGTNGFTPEHAKLLSDERVQTVAIGFDSDEAGHRGADSLAAKLEAAGHAVKVLYPPRGKDWNEALLAGVSHDEVLALLSAAPLRPPPTPSGPERKVERQGPRYVVHCGELRYRLLGVRAAFVSTLRVNVRVEKEGGLYLDNVDLYSARSRSLFSASAAQALELEASRVEKDLLGIVDYLEAERDRELQRASPQGQRELTEEERREGMELLQSPELFERIASDLETLGYVGEKLNKQLLYIAASSRKMADPISVLILSQSAAGKSLLVETVRRLMPEEDVVAVSSLSDQALNYIEEGGLMHKFLILGEAVHAEVVEHQIREMLSSHELSRLVVSKDVKTGELSSRTIRSPVVVSAVMSSTRSEMNPENASRAFLVNADESREQTRRIHESQRDKYSLGRHARQKTAIPRILRAHHAAQRLLTPRLIVNPFAERLSFPDALMRSRRDHERFVDLIAAVCFLRQYQKAEKDTPDPQIGETVRYIECDLTDYRISYDILCATLPSTLSSFPPAAVELYEAVRSLMGRKAAKEGLKSTEVSVTQREIREATGFAQRWIKRYLQLLADWEYLQVSGARTRGARNTYRLVLDESIRLVDLSAIPSPEAMESGAG